MMARASSLFGMFAAPVVLVCTPAVGAGQTGARFLESAGFQAAARAIVLATDRFFERHPPGGPAQ